MAFPIDEEGFEVESIQEKINRISCAYQKNQNITRIGAEIFCPYCEKPFIKKTKKHQFCQIPCKDRFWNLTNPRGVGVRLVEDLLDDEGNA